MSEVKTRDAVGSERKLPAAGIFRAQLNKQGGV